MGWLSLELLFGYLVITVGVRSLIQLKRTGSLGFRSVHGKAGSAEWWVAIASLVAVGGGLAAPVVKIVGVTVPRVIGSTTWLVPLALVLFGVGLLITFWAQLTMGDAWRIGVAQEETTALVSRGLYRWVRNPIYSAVLLTALGLSLLVPTLIALAAWCLLLLALELQVRWVEEPYMARVHGDAFRKYTQRAGRFVPLVGRQR